MSPEKYEIGSRAGCEKMVKEWGFSHVFTWTDPRYLHSPTSKFVHVICDEQPRMRDGTLTIFATT